MSDDNMPSGGGLLRTVCGAIMAPFSAIMKFCLGITHPWVVNTAAVCLCLIIVAAVLGLIPGIYQTAKNTGTTLSDTTKLPAIAASTTVAIASEAGQTMKEATEGAGALLRGDLNPAAPLGSDPVAIKEQNLASAGEATKARIASAGGATVIAVTNAGPGSIQQPGSLDFRLPGDVVDCLQDPSLSRELQRQATSIKSERKKAVDEIFDRVETKIPDFVKDHYLEREQKETFISLMNKQLLTDDELDQFVVNTALQIDQAIANAVSARLKASYVSIDFKTDTAEELRKRLPDAREICESVYRGLGEKGLNADRKSEILRSYDRLVVQYPKLKQISSVAFVVIVGYLFPPSIPYVATGLAVSWLHDIKVYEGMDTYTRELKNQFNEKRGRFKTLVIDSVDQLMTIYGQALQGCKIELKTPAFKP